MLIAYMEDPHLLEAHAGFDVSMHQNCRPFGWSIFSLQVFRTALLRAPCLPWIFSHGFSHRIQCVTLANVKTRQNFAKKSIWEPKIQSHFWNRSVSPTDQHMEVWAQGFKVIHQTQLIRCDAPTTLPIYGASCVGAERVPSISCWENSQKLWMILKP